MTDLHKSKVDETANLHKPEDACPDCGMRECCCFDDGEEPACLICGGNGWVDGSDHLDWDEDGYDDVIRCTSCKGSGLAKDMTWC